jgi:hypothetical protein
LCSHIEIAPTANSINTGGADAGIHKKNELTNENSANAKMNSKYFKLSLIIKLQREDGTGKVNSHSEQSGG